MGLVLWIDQNTFATDLIERVFKKKQLPFYTLPSVENFAYLVDDLQPVLIVLDGETYKAQPEKFRLQYEASERMRRTPFLLIEAVPELDFIELKVGVLTKPLDPFKLPEMLQEYLKLS